MQKTQQAASPVTISRTRWTTTAGLLLAATSLTMAAMPPADTVLLHGHIYTANTQQRWVEALAIRGDSIVAVGTTARWKSCVRLRPRSSTSQAAW